MFTTIFLYGEPFERGFFCDDETIRYPIKEGSIPAGLLYAYNIVLTIVVVRVKKLEI